MTACMYGKGGACCDLPDKNPNIGTYDPSGLIMTDLYDLNHGRYRYKKDAVDATIVPLV